METYLKKNFKLKCPEQHMRSRLLEFLQRFRVNNAKINDKYTSRILLSHNDLDGYGCNVVMRCSEYNLGDDDCSKIVYMNTASLNKDLYDKIANIIYTKTAEIHDQVFMGFYARTCICANTSSTFTPPTGNLQLLITDLGGLEVSRLAQIAIDNAAENVNVQIMVIDHHRSIYLEDTNFEDSENVVQFSKDGIVTKAIARYDNDDASVSVYMYINNESSATRLLDDMLREAHRSGLYADCSNDAIVTMYENLYAFSFAVSRYDTGNWGNWIIDKTDPIRSFNNDIDVAVILNNYWSWSYRRHNCGIVNAMTSFVDNLCQIIRYDVSLDNDILQQIYSNLLNMTHRYDEFVKRIQKVPQEIDGTYIVYSNDNGKVRIDYDRCIDNVFVIIDSPDDPKDVDHSYPYSMFAKRYLETIYYKNTDRHPASLMVRVNLKYNSIDMRSYGTHDYDTVNCYKIAKANGGGGHLGAAGFPMNLK